ncbi:9127_t:CDS:2, partial [Funneliformis caledonium]
FKEERKVLGVKMCEFASKELDVDHISVDFASSFFKNIFNANEKFFEKATLCTFAKTHEYKCGYVDQNGIRYDGASKLNEFIQVIGSIASKKKFIGCAKWHFREKNYRYLTIPNNVDLELLEIMFDKHFYHPRGIDFEKDESDIIEECFTIRPNSTRSDEFPFLHKVGDCIVKRIVKKSTACPVKFYYIIPKNLKECPFIVTISIGQHNHPSPPS